MHTQETQGQEKSKPERNNKILDLTTEYHSNTLKNSVILFDDKNVYKCEFSNSG